MVVNCARFVFNVEFTIVEIKNVLCSADISLSLCYDSIVMATKENLQSQKNVLYAITHRMNFITSILLCEILVTDTNDIVDSST